MQRQASHYLGQLQNLHKCSLPADFHKTIHQVPKLPNCDVILVGQWCYQFLACHRLIHLQIANVITIMLTYYSQVILCPLAKNFAVGLIPASSSD